MLESQQFNPKSGSSGSVSISSTSQPKDALIQTSRPTDPFLYTCVMILWSYSFSSTPNNLGTVRKINSVLFPVRYSEKFYQQILDETLSDFCKLS